MARKDRTGLTFGRLTILETLWNYKGKTTYCRCKCSCGNETIAIMGNVLKGKTRSCGCLERESRYRRNHCKLSDGDRFGKLVLVRATERRATNETIIWECRCDCGNITYVDTGNLTRGRVKSCGCDKPIHNTNFVNLTGLKFGKLQVLYEVPAAHLVINGSGKLYGRTRWRCLCECGNTVDVDGIELTTSHTLSCGCGRQSAAEILVGEILSKYNFIYEREYRFKDCADIYPLPFDFYIPNMRVAIECDGEQHYKPIDFFGGEKGYQTRVKHDKMKEEYCVNNNIELIRLPYFLSESEITNIIDELKIRNE